MNKLFYFSKTNLKYIEIKNFKLKLFSVLLALSLFFAALYIVVYYVLGVGTNSDLTIAALKNENKALKKEIERLADSYQELVSDVENISELNSELRISANLEPISDEERMLGVGGGESYLSSNFNIRDIEVRDLLESVDEMINVVKFEKNQTTEISEKLRINQELHNCIPAIMPTLGNYSIDGFGMRRHPILGVKKFHHGIDINCNTGLMCVHLETGRL